MRPSRPVLFEPYLTRWSLAVDGEPLHTRSSHLLPVRRDGGAAMLKIAKAAEERAGAALMIWWNGRGAAQVLASDDTALLLERAEGHRDLVRMAAGGFDDEASRAICGVVAELHAPVDRPPPTMLVPLERRFADLGRAADRHGGILATAWATAQDLLNDPREIVVLHGDIHHGNILDFGPRGWLAIDPKGLRGERGFDYANLLCNPKGPRPAAPGRLARQVEVVAAAARLDRDRLLRWVIAWAGLSAAWFIDDDMTQARETLAIARLAAAEITRS